MWAACSSARRHGDMRISMVRAQWQCYVRAHILAECGPVAVASSAERAAKDGWVECICCMLRPIRFVQVFVVEACSMHVVGRDVDHRKKLAWTRRETCRKGASFPSVHFEPRSCLLVSPLSSHLEHKSSFCNRRIPMCCQCRVSRGRLGERRISRHQLQTWEPNRAP